MVAPSSSCNHCGCAITADELVQGLAVKVDGAVLCPQCVDSLPGEAQLSINQMRALRGLNTTTYLVQLPRHRALKLYTFTTAGNISAHRRTVEETGVFDAIPLPPPGERVGLPVVPRGATSTARKAPRRGRVMAMAGGVALVVLGGLSILALRTHMPARVQAAAPPAAPTVAVERIPQRTDYPVEPLAAWRQASQDADCPQDLLAVMVADVVRQRTAQLDAAARHLDGQRADDSLPQLDAMALPDRIDFREVRDREATLRARYASAKAPAEPFTPAPPIQPTRPEPVVVAQPPQPPVVATRIDPPPPAIATNPSTPPPVLPPATPSVPAAPPTPSSPRNRPADECWLVHTADLRKRGDLGLERVLPMTKGGEYQIWARVGSGADAKHLNVTIGKVQLGGMRSSDFARVGAWLRLRNKQGDVFTIDPGTPKLVVNDAFAPLKPDFYVAGTTYPPPTDALQLKALARSPWTGSGEPPPGQIAPSTPIPTAVIAHGAPTIVFPANAKPEPLDGSVVLPTPLPYASSDIHRSQRPTSGPLKRQHLTIELDRAAIADGGVTLLINRARPDRKALGFTIESAGVRTPLEPLALADSDEWQALAVPLPLPPAAAAVEGDGDAGADRVRLTMEDAEDRGGERGFLLAKVTCVAHRAPDVADVGSTASPLISPDPVANREARQRLAKLIAQVTERRPGKLRSFDPRRVHLIGADFSTSWQNDTREVFKRIAGIDLPGAGDFALTEDGYEAAQFTASRPLLDNTAASVVLISMQGLENSPLRDPEALSKWIQRLAGHLVGGDKSGRNGGFLPVVVIGHLQRVDVSARNLVKDAWARAEEDCTRLGIPVIDLRPAQIGGDQGAIAKRTGQMLADASRSLAIQLTWMMRSAR